MPGFWRRPVTRMYSYNLDVGENYYKPMSNYLDRNSSVERTARAETPGCLELFSDHVADWEELGAMTFAERLQHTGRISGRRYEGSARSTSVARESAQAAASSSAEHTSAFARRGVRAASEMPATAVSSAQAGRESAERQMSSAVQLRSAHAQQSAQRAESASRSQTASALRQESMQSTQIAASAKQASMSHSREETTETVQRASASSATAKMVQRMRAEQNQQRMEVMQRASSQQRTSRREEKQSAAAIKAGEIKVKDCIEKKIADIRMQPYVGAQEVREAEAASLRARARILDLERELDEITKRAIMTSTKAVQSAKQMAYQASMEAQEEAKAASTKKSRKVIVESSSSMKA